jgi:hypothetical protein
LEITRFSSGACVIISTVAVFITLTAGYRSVHALRYRITGIYRTIITIITFDKLSLLTGPVSTVIVFCAHVTIVTGILIMYVLAATNEVTSVIGADITVIAVRYRARNTQVIYTGLNTGAHIIVTAVFLLITLTPPNRVKHTPRGGIAGICGTTIAIITHYGIALTSPAGTGIMFCTGITIITGCCIVAVLAA